MGKNINQIGNVAGSLLATDKLYLGRSPFGAGDDFIITGQGFITQFLNAIPSSINGSIAVFSGTSGHVIAAGGVPGAANGLATLDSGGLVPSSQIPPLTINNTYVVANQAARLALSANVGDICVQTDTNITYILQQLPPSTNANWIVISAPGGTVTMVSVTAANGVSAVVSNASTTPDLTFTLGAITPSSIVASGTIAGSNLSGTNTGDQTITLTGDVTGSGSGSFAATIAANAVTYAKFQQASAGNVVLCNPTASAANYQQLALSASQLLGRGSSGNLAAISPDGTSCQISGNTLSVIGAPPSGTAGGDLTGTYPNPSIANNAVSYAKFQMIVANSLTGNPTGSLANMSAIGLDSTLSFSGSNIQRSALTGDVTASAGSNTTTIAANTVSYAKIQQASAGNVVLCNPTSGAANYQELVISGSSLVGRGSSGNIANIAPDGVTCTITGTNLVVLGAPPTGSAGGDLTGTYPNPTLGTNVVSYSKLQQVAAVSLVGNATGALANATGITLNSTLSFSGSTLQRAALTGDVTASAGSNITTIANNAVTFAKFQQIAGSSLIGNSSVSTGNIQAISLNATLSFSGTSIQREALTGDVTASAGSNTTTIANSAVTYAKIQNVTNARLLGNNSGGAAAPSEIALDSSLAFSGASTLQRAALTGDVTASAGSNSTTLATVNSNVGTFTNATVTVNGKGLITAVSSGTGASAAYAFGLPYTNGKWIQATSSTLSSTPQSIYTCPLGKKGIIYGLSVRNTGGSGQFTLVGPSLPNLAIFAATVAANTTVTDNVLYILNPGDNLQIANLTASVIVYVSFTLLEVDSSYQLSTTTKSSSWISGANTLYTVPVGKTATMISAGGPGALVGSTVSYYNNSGSSSTSSFSVQESGGSTRQITTSTAIPTQGLSTTSFSYSGNAGQIITVASTQTGNQFAWVTMWET